MQDELPVQVAVNSASLLTEAGWLPRLTAPDRLDGLDLQAILANVRGKSAPVNETFRWIVTALAQAQERAEPEFIDVAAMRLDVIADCPGVTMPRFRQ